MTYVIGEIVSVHFRPWSAAPATRGIVRKRDGRGTTYLIEMFGELRPVREEYMEKVSPLVLLAEQADG
ncbi:MAG: hypothetical protein ACXABY_26110 [Candidatus Thorarchaeota archaeon]|jgi:hypothetical protein